MQWLTFDPHPWSLGAGRLPGQAEGRVCHLAGEGWWCFWWELPLQGECGFNTARCKGVSTMSRTVIWHTKEPNKTEESVYEGLTLERYGALEMTTIIIIIKKMRRKWGSKILGKLIIQSKRTERNERRKKEEEEQPEGKNQNQNIYCLSISLQGNLSYGAQ